MRLINISDYDSSSMILAKPIYDSRKRILIAAGKSIDPKFIEKLISIGIHHLFIEDDVSRGISIDDMLDMPTWTDAIQILKQFFESVEKGEEIVDITKIQWIANKLIDEVKSRPTMILIPSSTITKELKLFAHSINVSILSLLVGKKLGYNGLQLRDLVMGSLLHDIGKALTVEYTEHAEVGFNVLRKVNELSLISAHIAYQHHETIDGKGYPRGLKGKDLLEVAQICGLADYYENLLSEESFSPHEAIEAVMSLGGSTYNFTIVQAFSQAVPIYPPGTKVIIAKREPAIVTRIDKHMQRPVVRIISRGKELSLAEHPTIMIEPF